MPSATAFALALALNAVGQDDWFEPFPAHRVIGNVYYVGSKDLASYLITTPEGHILINSGFERDRPPDPRSRSSRSASRWRDIKILLASHAHSDHVAGHALCKELTGAKVYVMRGRRRGDRLGGRGAVPLHRRAAGSPARSTASWRTATRSSSAA